MNVRPDSPSEYCLSAKRVGELLSRDVRSVAKIAAAAGIRVCVLPGVAPRYHKGDVESLATQMFRVAGDPMPSVLERETVAI